MHASLGPEAKELLLAAAKSEGVIYRIETQQLPAFVRVGRRNFVDPDDPSVAAVYSTALSHLCMLEHAEFRGEALYELTGTGWQVAQTLTGEGEQG